MNGYAGKAYFCDRVKELNIFTEDLNNGRNITLVSLRRLGKTALIYRLFEQMEEEGIACIFVDIFATLNLKELTEAIAMAVFSRFPQKKGLGKRLFDFLLRFHPVVTYDPLTGVPEIHFVFSRTQEYEQTLRELFAFLEAQELPIIMAIDEFQQIATYPEKNTEALLRTLIQPLQHIHFIFSGSKKHLMLEIFAASKRPFFASTEIIGLEPIPQDIYKAFICKQFEQRKRQIDEEAADFILSWTMGHTYYTQVIANQVFAGREKKVGIETVKQACDRQLTTQQVAYMQYNLLLSPVQWKMMVGIAKEGLVQEPQSQDFLARHKINAASSARKALDALLEKEMVCQIEQDGKPAYRVYDVFLLRWLARKF
jgi:AAA+ ATPase superfamily predicted ATPase